MASIVQYETDTPFSTPIFQPSSHRCQSFSSFSSFSSISSLESSISNHDDYFSFPSTPFRISGIPFSWEQLPGIPKEKISNKNDSSHSLLPLPPASNYSSFSKKFNDEISPKKSTSDQSFQKDPFFTALVECSKDEHENPNGGYWKGSKLTRTFSDRIEVINMYISCKTSCAVSESVVYLPRSRTYNLLRRRGSS